MRVNCLNSLLSLADHGARILGLLLVGILTSSGLALAQSGSGNEAIYRDGRTPLFNGSSLDMSDLFRAAELLSRQRATSRWDSRGASMPQWSSLTNPAVALAFFAGSREIQNPSYSLSLAPLLNLTYVRIARLFLWALSSRASFSGSPRRYCRG
jgi:hypothetical protein